jgi:hypothetical protein
LMHKVSEFGPGADWRPVPVWAPSFSNCDFSLFA